MKITLPSKQGANVVELPDSWDVEVISPRQVTVPPRDQAIQEAFDSPVGSPRLEELPRSLGRCEPHRACIICEDLTRYSPTSQILPYVLDRLNAAGIPDSDIIIVMALGTHRPMTEAEIDTKLGPETHRRVAVFNSEFRNKERLVQVGTFGDYPLWLDRRVAESSFRVGVGSIVPNPVSGWSGGAKIVIPGVTGEETVNGFHLSSHEFRSNMFGQEMTASRKLMEDLVREIGLHFVVNTVYTPDNEIYSVHCGDFVLAQRAAVRRAKEVYGAPAHRKSQLVISNAYPADTDLWQAGKGFHSGDVVCADGGEVAILAACPEGVGPHKSLPMLYQWALRDRPGLLRAVKAGEIEDAIAASSALMRTRTIMDKKRLGIVSDNLDPDLVARMGFAAYDSLDSLIQRYLSRDDRSLSVSVITHGGSTLPVLDEDTASSLFGI